MDTLFRRRAMISAPSGGLLPAEYQQVEYLQGNGSAYIDLGVKNKTTFGCRVKTELGTGIGGFVCGASNNNGYGIGFRFRYSTITYTAGAGGEINTPNAIKGTVQSVQANFYGSGEGFVEGFEAETKLSPLPPKSYANTSFNFLLFAYVNYQGSVVNISSAPVYDFQLTDGQDLIMDLYPCYRKSDGKPGIYDILTDTFHTNANPSGNDFTVGPNI